MVKSGAIAWGLCLAWGLATVVAAPVDTKDAADFTHRWDFDLADDGAGINDSLDLYNNTTGAVGADGVNDWTVNANGASVVITDGVMMLINVANGNSIWAAGAGVTGISTTTGFTLETRVQMSPNTTEGNNGGLILDANLAVNGGGTNSPFAAQYPDMTVGDSLNIYYDLGPTGPVYATVLAADYFTVRIAGTPDGSGGLVYSLYVNDTLVGDNLGPERINLTAARLLIGDIGGGARGVTTIDYIAFTPGAFAPVPEPASMALLVAGAGLMIVRRREA